MGKLRFEIYDGQLIRIDENDCEVIHIPEGIQSVENYAFDRCKNLKEVYFPASVMKICHGIFENCKLLKKIEVSPDNPYFDSKPLNGVLYEKKRFYGSTAYKQGRRNARHSRRGRKNSCGL